MTISATVLADSISPQGIRLTTFRLRYPRFIHGECKTHRIIRLNDAWVDLMEETGFMDDPNLSRNASSSRAMGIKRLIAEIRRDPAMPIHWGKHQPGMQAHAEHDGLVSCPTLSGGCEDLTPKEAWLRAMELAISMAEAFAEAGYHKQIVNRLLEPFAHINIVCTATDYANFYALRRHPDAQPEIIALADAMWEAQRASTPKLLQPGEWHLPYITAEDWRESWNRPSQSRSMEMLKAISVARCARVSYQTASGRAFTIEEDLDLYNRLIERDPRHASPAEHQATPDTESVRFFGETVWDNPHEHGNLRGFRQLRKMLPNECVHG